MAVPFEKTLDPNLYLNQLFQLNNPVSNDEKRRILQRQTDPLKKQYDQGAFNARFPLIVEEIGTIETTDNQAREHLRSFWEQQIQEKERSKRMQPPQLQYSSVNGERGSVGASIPHPKSSTNMNSKQIYAEMMKSNPTIADYQ